MSCSKLLVTLVVITTLGCDGGMGPATSTGGRRGTGGQPLAGTGGRDATGGSTVVGGTGGASATGGVRGTGGTSATGGVPGSSGSTGMGGSSGCKPDYGCQPPAPSTGDYYADCVARVNQFRACVCLPPLARWTAGEACADMDAAYDSSRSAHAGFLDDICSPAGNAQDECPGWGSAKQVVSSCLQGMFDEGPPPTGSCSGDCYETHGHFINMTNTRYTMVACGIATLNGQVTAVQNFK